MHKKLKNIFIPFLFFALASCSFSVVTFASDPAPKAPEEIKKMYLDAIYYQLYKQVEKVQKNMPAPSQEKSSINQGQRGKMIVEKLKAQARAKIAKSKGLDPQKMKSGKDIVRGEIQDNKNFIRHMQKIKKQMEQMKKRSLSPKEWKRKYKEIYQQWQKQKEEYKKNIKIHQDNLVDIPVILPVSNKELKKKTKIIIDKEYYFVEGSLQVPIKNQLARPTCSAFSAIRAMEIELIQNNNKNNKTHKLDLSEQYFYWASKPNCRHRRCDEAGSWVGHGLLYSKEQQNVDIPLESDCKYVNYSQAGNQTQIPLTQSCQKGAVKVKSFSYLKNLDQVVGQLMENKPVIASIKLTPNFYNNHGIILYSQSSIGPKMDGHAAGHSVLLIGLVKLPSVLEEGKYCFIVANSWGQGWGQGGHSCLSENWLIENRSANPFVVINSMSPY